MNSLPFTIAYEKLITNKTENQVFHARQTRKGIFEICSHWSCNFVTFFLDLLMATSIPGDEIFN